ncbi:MAG: phage major capsid protein [Thermoplasmata archaeon]|nr:MAG: phage major capsid protein [Thermoplasmata archaeon]
MASRFVKLLEYAFAGNSERKRMLNSEAFKKTVGEKAVKMLLQAEDISETTLLQEEVIKKVYEGAEPAKCVRNVFPVQKTKSYSVRFVVGSPGAYAKEVPEGSAVPVDQEGYSKVDVEVKKYATRPLITKEMIDDCLFNIIEHEIKKAGLRLENTLNRVVLEKLLTEMDGITAIDPAGTHIAVTDIAEAISKVKEKNWMPDVLITHPAAEGYLLQDSNLAYVAYAGTEAPLREGTIPRLLGLKPYTLSVTPSDESGVYWDGTDADNHYYGLVLDSNNTAVIVMRDDITVTRYEDPIRDLEGIIAKMRFGVGILHDDAGVRILSK